MASAKDSHLTFMKPGFDLVVATTQGALNATILNYLDKTEQKPQVVYYVWQKNPTTGKVENTALGQKEFLEKSSNVDPFKIPATADAGKDKDLNTLKSIAFNYAFSITPGIPTGATREKIPPVVVLGQNTSSVTYNMICKDIMIREMVYSPVGDSWNAIDQPSDDIWGFQASVDLRLEEKGPGAINNLPKEIQDKIKNTGGDAFSIQQLLFDLDNAALQGSPAVTINGATKSKSGNLGPDAATFFDRAFLSLYYGQMHKEGQPLLHVAVTRDSPEISQFRATKINMHVNPWVELKGVTAPSTEEVKKKLTTLDYVATCFGRKDLPSPRPFEWNWVNESEATQWDGIMAINRKTFAEWLKHELWDQAKASCWDFNVSLPVESGSMTIKVSWENGHEPTYNYWDSNDDTLFTMDYKQNNDRNKDGAGAKDISGHYGLGYLEITPEYHCAVSVSGNTITIVQHVLVDVWLIKGLDHSHGHYLDRQREDQYILKANASGGLEVEYKHVRDFNWDNRPTVNWFNDFFTNTNETSQWTKNLLDKNIEPRLTQFPLSIAQNFHFPGGRVFAFKNVEFSKYQDLTAAISYAEPH